MAPLARGPTDGVRRIRRRPGARRPGERSFAHKEAAPASLLVPAHQLVASEPAPGRQVLVDGGFHLDDLKQLTRLSDVKASLDEGYPAVFGFVVFSSIREASKTGMLPVPSLQEDEVLGGHATVAVGYDDEKGCLILRNSWSDQWGDKGYFYMPYEYFNTQFGLVADGWTLREQ